MAQKTRIVGLDVAKNKVDACIRSAGVRLMTPSTPEGQAELVHGCARTGSDAR
jgi:hypothetical protein